MTISSETRKAGPYAGTGSTGPFTFAFKVFTASDILAVKADSDGTETTLTLTTDFTASLNADQNNDPGGTITLVSALATGHTLTLSTQVENLQETDLTNGGGFYPDVIEDALDRATIQIQQLQEQVDRAVKVPISSTIEPTDYITEVKIASEEAQAASDLVVKLYLGAKSSDPTTDNDGGALIAGAFYYNTTDSRTKVYSGLEWVYAWEANPVSFVVDVFSGDGSTVDFNLSADPSSLYNLDIAIDGVVQVAGVDFVWPGDLVLRFISPPPNGSEINVRYMESLPHGAISWSSLQNIPLDAVNSLATLQAYTGSATTVYVRGRTTAGDGYEGTFQYLSGNYSAECTADTLHGIYVARSGVATTTGAWVRQYSGPINVRWFGAKGDGVNDDSSAINAAFSLGGGFVFPARTYLVASEITAGSNVFIEFQNTTLKTSADITLLRFGSGAASTEAFSHGGFTGNLILQGSGSGKTNNNGLVIRNFSYGDFSGSAKFTNIGGTALTIEAYGRGVQYNKVGAAWEITASYGTVFDLNAGTEAGGYINDNQFHGIRTHAQAATGITHAKMRGLMVDSNRFYGIAFETSNAADTLLDMDTATANGFYGLRLDGVTGTTCLNIASGVVGNMFYGYTTDGSVVDASGRNTFFGDQGSLDLPFMRLGSALNDGSAQAWEFAMSQPGSTDELRIGAIKTGGVMRVPTTTIMGIGDREGGDNSPLEFDPANKRMYLWTLSSTAIGSGPELRFDSRFSSSGNYGTIIAKQTSAGLQVTPSLATSGLVCSTYFALGTGTGPIWKSGTGSPESVVTAPVGSIYSRTDGGAGTSLYVKQAGTGNTGWVGK